MIIKKLKKTFNNNKIIDIINKIYHKTNLNNHNKFFSKELKLNKTLMLMIKKINFNNKQ